MILLLSDHFPVANFNMILARRIFLLMQLRDKIFSLGLNLIFLPLILSRVIITRLLWILFIVLSRVLRLHFLHQLLLLSPILLFQLLGLVALIFTFIAGITLLESIKVASDLLIILRSLQVLSPHLLDYGVELILKFGSRIE